MIKKEGILIILFLAVLMSTTVLAFPKDVGLNVKAEDNGVNKPGTYTYQFNISRNSDCSGVDWTQTNTITTKSDATFNITLNNVDLDFSAYDYRLCVYRNGVLTLNTNMTSVLYAFYSQKSNYSSYSNNSNYLGGQSLEQIKDSVLKLNQTTPQTVYGTPYFSDGITTTSL